MWVIADFNDKQQQYLQFSEGTFYDKENDTV